MKTFLLVMANGTPLTFLRYQGAHLVLQSLALLFCGSRAAMPSEFVITLDAEASQEEKFAASMLHKYLPASGVGSDGGHRTKLMVVSDFPV